MKKLIKLTFLLCFGALFVQGQDNPPNYKNFSYYYVFGPNGVDEYGKNDQKQIIYISVPNYLPNFELMINDPGSSSPYEAEAGEGEYTTTKFSVFGGSDIKNLDTKATLLTSSTFTDTPPGTSVSLGKFNTNDGFKNGNASVFKLVAEGLSGARLNLFSVETSSRDIITYTKQTAVHFSPKNQLNMAFTIEVPEGTTLIRETNSDMADAHLDDNLKLSLNGVELKVSKNAETVTNEIPVSKPGFYTYLIMPSKKDQFNNAFFDIRDQDGNFLTMYNHSQEDILVHRQATGPGETGDGDGQGDADGDTKDPDIQSFVVDTSLLSMVKSAPAKGSVGEEYTITMEITAKQDIQDIIVSGLAPANAEIVSSAPPLTRQADSIVWTIPSMSKGEVQTIQLTLKPLDQGTVDFCSGIVAVPRVCTTSVVGKAELEIVKEGPPEAMLGSQVTYSVKVTNKGNVLAKNVTITDTVPDGLEHATKNKTLTIQLGDLEPGESKVEEMTFTAVQRGEHCNVASASAVNAEEVNDQACTVISQPGLKIVKTGTERQFTGKMATYDIQLTNTGDTALKDVVVTDILPEGTRLINPENYDVEGNKITWTVASLQPEEVKNYTVSIISLQAGTLCNTVSVQDSTGLSDSAEACTQWEGHPAILFEVVDTEDPILPGEETSYIIKITNQGTAPDTNVSFSATFTDEVSPLSVEGPTEGMINGKTVTVKTLPVLKAKEAIEWKIKAKAVKTGDARITFKLSSDILKRQPVIEEESTQVY